MEAVDRRWDATSQHSGSSQRKTKSLWHAHSSKEREIMCTDTAKRTYICTVKPMCLVEVRSWGWSTQHPCLQEFSTESSELCQDLKEQFCFWHKKVFCLHSSRSFQQNHQHVQVNVSAYCEKVKVHLGHHVTTAREKGSSLYYQCGKINCRN